jgi:hypothetical protein
MAMRRAEIVLLIVLCAIGIGMRASLRPWVFGGSDSYQYMKLSDELREHGRYALAPEPEQLHFGRPPLYPIFLMAAKGSSPAAMTGGSGWYRIEDFQIAVDVLLALGLFFLARRAAGTRASWIALALWLFSPFSIMFANSVLAETLGAALTVAALAPLLLLRDEKAERSFALAGAGVALASLLRPDGILLVVAFLPALRRFDWRRRARLAAIAAAAFLVVFSPWPIRNKIQFGHAYPLGTRVDRFGHPVVNHAGLARWIASWDTSSYGNSLPTTCLHTPGCRFTAAQMQHDRARPFESPAEEAEVARLLALHDKEGMSPAVDAGFDALASARLRRHPLEVLLLLPVERGVKMWTGHMLDEVMPNPPKQIVPIRRALDPLQGLFGLLMVVGGALAVRDERLRSLGWTALAVVGARTAVLGFTAICTPRYTFEALPLAILLIAVGATCLRRPSRRSPAPGPLPS